MKTLECQPVQAEQMHTNKFTLKSTDFHGKSTSKLQSVTCHMGSQCKLPLERAPTQPQTDKLVLNSPTPKGQKAELTLVLITYQTGLPAHSHPSK